MGRTKSIKNYMIIPFMVIIGLIFIIFNQFSGTAKNNIEEKTIHANHIVYEDINELIHDSELIVLATVTDKSENMNSTHSNTDQDIEEFQVSLFTGHTLTEVTIDKIFKGALSTDVITVIEPTFINESGDEVIRYHWGKYTKLIPGSKYILFLQSDGNIKGYWISSLHQGKFNIDGKDLDEKEMTNHSRQYALLRKQVLEKFDID